MNTTKYRIFVLIYCVLVLLVSSIPGDTLNSFKLVVWDKALHFLEYSILGLLLVFSLKQKQVVVVLMVLAGGMIFGIFDEVWQQFILNRSSSIFDWFADVIGILFGGMVSLVISRRRISAISKRVS